MLDIDVSDRKEQRKFGLVMAAAICILAMLRTLIRFLLHGTVTVPVWFFVVAAPFLVLALVWPKALQPVFAAWLKLALVLNWIITHVLLTVVFYLILTPMGIVMRITGKDPLKRTWLSADQSYWEAPEPQPEGIEPYTHLF